MKEFRSSFTSRISFILALSSVLLLVSPAYSQDWDWQSCANWTQTYYGNWMIRNNIWGSHHPGAGTQCVYANSERNWHISSTHQNGTGLVKGYPHATRGWVMGGVGNTYPNGSPSPFVTNDHGLNMRVDELTKFDIYHNMTLPRTGRYLGLYDMYMYYTDTPQLPYEQNKPDQLVMIFFAQQDNTGWLYTDADQYPLVTIGERQWRLRVNPSGIVNEMLYILYPYPDRIRDDILIDYLEILHYLQEHHNLPGNLRISTIQFGIEPIDGGEYTVNDFWVDISTDPAGGDPGPFTLTVNSTDGGSVTTSPQQVEYEAGEQVTLTAVPDEGYEFRGWSGALTGQNNPATVTMTSNRTVSATFGVPTPPGELITNGDFSSAAGWNLYAHTDASAAATGSVVNGEYAISITNGGTEEWNVQLSQSGISLEQGKSYIVSFDARAASPRDIVVNVGQTDDPWDSYGADDFSLTEQMVSYSFQFTMTAATDNNARIEFNCGIESADVFIDNVSLMESDAVGAISKAVSNSSFSAPRIVSSGGYYNLGFSIAQPGSVTASVYDMRGRLVNETEWKNLSAGTHHKSIRQTGTPGAYIAVIRHEGKVLGTVRCPL